ncbi:MAG TPA: tRNA 2-thiouridine(34) synthase MnmA [Mogibacterium sp.]|nr:tRNA 2-thiouridine(34) synthase MnmA [Mogibacterium sp.]
MYTNVVFIAMSGGVDSSVAAYLLKEEGYQVHGVTMRLYDSYEKSYSCGQSIPLANAVAEKLNIPFHAIDMRDEFKANVVEKFINQYEKGLTPNPCIICNKTIKFGELFEFITHKLRNSEISDYDILNPEDFNTDNHPMIATGHYAIIEQNKNGRYMLRKSNDLSKDQSYFLYTLTQEILSRTVFPLGRLSSKDEVRRIADEQGFVNAKVKDSQDVCFIPDGKYSEFINSYTGKEYTPGNFVDINGRILGTHKGIINYTIGQRKGLGISLGKPMYVYRLDIKNNSVILAEDSDLYETKLIADNMNWVSIEEPKVGDRRHALGRIRYRHAEAPCTVTMLEGGKAEVVFDEPQRAITPGQSIVFYDIATDSYVLGGGIIQ